MTGIPLLSVVIPTYQRCASVHRALQALSRQTLPAKDFEVIVSIDGSEDGTTDLVGAFAAPYALHGVWQANAGRASACNRGITVSLGRIIVLLDDDMEPLPGCLQAHWRAHQGAQRRAVMGAVPVALNEQSGPTARYIGEKFETHGAKLAQSGYSIGFRDFYSGNLSVRRDVMVEVGLFDPEFKVYGNEDSELALRLLRAGVELVYDREAAATQHYEKDFAALARDNAAKGRTAVLCLRKYPETIASLRQRSHREGSWKWRVVRRLLLTLTAAVRQTSDLVVHFIDWQERRHSPELHRYYRLALDYFFWLGAGREMKDQGGRAGVSSL